ncbi:hypothetical protein ABB27_18895 [Stenotrophomonas terrae]|uniref:Uncharacterized protein n=1 Tax=Stenotrophomonas terrae TaxID=405446 RepID=A0A0R0BW35_9GAMM|nr:hypothetical protein ABB27_18895 [Stenotrophomonas terrae]
MDAEIGRPPHHVDQEQGQNDKATPGRSSRRGFGGGHEAVPPFGGRWILGHTGTEISLKNSMLYSPGKIAYVMQTLAALG